MKLADRMDRIKPSPIREFMAIAKRPEVTSFAGGMPASDLFPIDQINAATDAVMKEDPYNVLEYATTEGLPRLREQIAERMREKQNVETADADKIIMLSGSQEGLSIAGQVFLNKGDLVLMESPSYLGAINAFNLCEPNFLSIPTDDEGMIIEELEKVLAENDNVKLIYVIPTFQNPSGKTWSLERRKQFMEVVNKYEVAVLEDNPYGELRYEGEDVPPLAALDTKGLVVYLGSFSKVFVPGYRTGWMFCQNQEIVDKFNFVKQAFSTQTPSSSMMVLSKWLDMFSLDDHIEVLRDYYRRKKNAMVKILAEELPEGCKFTDPEGGIFTWVELPEGMDAKDLSMKLIERNVAIIIGTGFYPEGGHENTLRLNFSNSPEEKIIEGTKIFCEVVKENLK